MPQQQGVAHIMLSVTDAAKSAAWYREVFDGQSVVSTEDQYGPLEVVVADSLVLGFRTHRDTRPGDRFDETRVGADHIGIACTNETLDAWLVCLDELGVEHSDIIEDSFGKHLNFRDPDNIALELFVPAG